MKNEISSAIPGTARANWPDLSKDQRAYELAKAVSVPGEPLTDTIARAQRIKESL